MVGEKAVVFQGGQAVDVQFVGWRKKRKVGKSVPEGDILQRIGEFYAPPKNFFPIPSGVKFFRFRGTGGVLAVELEPKVRQVRWEKAHGRRFENRRLAFPFVVLVFPFAGGVLEKSACQVFYTRAPLESWADELLMTSLLNVSGVYGQQGLSSYISMGNYAQEPGLSWQDAVENAIRHFWWSAFRVGAVPSHFTHAKELSPIFASVEAWQQASRDNPRFMLDIPWPTTGHTVLSAMEIAMSRVVGTSSGTVNLYNLMQDA